MLIAIVDDLLYTMAMAGKQIVKFAVVAQLLINQTEEEHK